MSRPVHLARILCSAATAAMLVLGAARPASAQGVDGGLGGLGGLTSTFGGDTSGIVSPEGAWGLAWGGQGLGQVDVISGQLRGDLLEGSNFDRLVVDDLISNQAMEINARQLADRARAEAEARRMAAGQTAVGPDGCPTAAPTGTLRSGAEQVGVAELCARSVAQARSPEAATAIKWALAQIGRPYSQPQRMEEGSFDCSSLVTRAYEAAGVPLVSKYGRGWAPTTFTILPAPWAPAVSEADARPGDLWFPDDGHVGMVLADGYIVHTNRTGDVANVTRPWGTMTIRAVDPSRV